MRRSESIFASCIHRRRNVYRVCFDYNADISSLLSLNPREEQSTITDWLPRYQSRWQLKKWMGAW